MSTLFFGMRCIVVTHCFASLRLTVSLQWGRRLGVLTLSKVLFIIYRLCIINTYLIMFAFFGWLIIVDIFHLIISIFVREGANIVLLSLSFRLLLSALASLIVLLLTLGLLACVTVTLWVFVVNITWWSICS